MFKRCIGRTLGELWPRLAVACIFLPATPTLAGRINTLTVETRGERTQVTIDFDGPFRDPQLFALDGPPRLILDIADLSAKSGPVQPGNGVVRSFRFGQPQPGTGRVVLDLNGPAQVVETRTFDPEEGVSGMVGKYRLVIDLRPATTDQFNPMTKTRRRIPGSLAAMPASKPAAPPAKPADKPTAPADEPPPPPPPQQIQVQESRPALAEKIRGRLPIVVVDAGHGGQDPGAPSVLTGRREKEATLAIARAIKTELDSTGKFKVVLTRSTDIFIPLGGRVEIARQANADLFMSIHADSIAKPDIRGATVYTLSQKASDKEAEKLAEKENKADIITGINLGGESPDVTNILIDLAQRETMNYSAEFAQVAVKEMSRNMFFRSNFHRFAGFVVLKAPDVPSVLIETGYMSNEDDSKFLFSADGQKAIASGVRKAVERYFDRRVEN